MGATGRIVATTMTLAFAGFWFWMFLATGAPYGVGGRAFLGLFFAIFLVPGGVLLRDVWRREKVSPPVCPLCGGAYTRR